MSLMSMIFLVICTYSFSRLRINDIVDFNYIRTYIDFYFYLFMKKKNKKVALEKYMSKSMTYRYNNFK